MSDGILLVDDEPNVLSAYRRQLRKVFQIDTAEGPEQGLECFQGEKEYAVVMSDMQMPGMNGVEFLQEVRRLSPDSVRLMLTGNADQKTAISAINDGAVFRFLNKPCSTEDMTVAINDALEQHRLITAERDLIENTVKGSIGVLTDILALINPVAFGRTRGIQDHVAKFCGRVRLERAWELEIAAMLSQLGCVTIPEDVLARSHCGDELSETEADMIRNHPTVAAQLVRKIPRLEGVAELVEAQMYQEDEKLPTGSDLPREEVRVLKAAARMEFHTATGGGLGAALWELKSSPDYYGEEIIGVVSGLVDELPEPAREITFEELCAGMVLAEPLCNGRGQVLVGTGQEITEAMLMRITNFAANAGIQEPIMVYGPN